MLTIFSYACWPFILPFWGNVYLDLLLTFLIGLCVCRFFFFFNFCCMSCLYILEMSPLQVALFVNIFSLSVSFLFILLVSFALQKLLTLIRSHLFIFVFIFITLIKKCVSEIYVSLLSTFRVKFILRTQLLLKVYRKRNQYYKKKIDQGT